MKQAIRRSWLAWMVLVAGCAGAPAPAVQPPAAAAPAVVGACDEYQSLVSHYADRSAARQGKPGIAEHLAKHFPDGMVSWVMTKRIYDEKIAATETRPRAKVWGRAGHQFAAPTAVLEAKLEEAKRDGAFDVAVLERAIGAPPGNYKGAPLLMMTLDLRKAGSCVRLPVCADPGAARVCKDDQDEACFRFGGSTTGGVPEVMMIDAPVDQTAIRPIP